MRTHESTILGIGALAVIAGAARAQYGGDPGLDPRVAKHMQPPIPVQFECKHGHEAGAADSPPVTWPGGIVPIAFESGSLDSLSLGAMDAWMYRSGTSPNVTFVLRDPANPAHHNFLYIKTVPGGVSGSYVGIVPGGYDPSLSGPPPAGGQYVYRGTNNNTYVMAHEFCHALGFWHEHTRPDRDSFIWVYYNRVYPQTSVHNFYIQPDWVPGSVSTGYDFDSVMHYSATSFMNPSCDGGLAGCLSVLTCTPLQARPDLGYGIYQCTMGQQNHLSNADVADMVNVYGARSRPLSFVGPYGSGGGTLSNPHQSPAAFGGGGDVYFQGGSSYHVAPGTRFTTAATWKKHSTGIAVVTAP